MGQIFSECTVCQGNTLIMQICEQDMDNVKKDLDSGKQNENGNTNNMNNDKLATESSQISDTRFKNSINKKLPFTSILDRHMNQTKLNTSGYNTVNLEKRKKTLADICDITPILYLKVINTNSSLEKGLTILINSQGFVNPNKVSRFDGYTYFGYSKTNTINESGIDFVIPLKEGEVVSEKNLGKHFVIEYNTMKTAYTIRDLGIGFGAFVRLDFPLVLKNNHLINLGEAFIVVNIISKSTDSDCLSVVNTNNFETLSGTERKGLQLRLKIFGLINNGDTYYFDCNKEYISIGRNTKSDIHISDKLLSKIHCNISFSETQGWIMRDGDETNYSTNGTWLYLNEDFEIYDKMIFKSNQTIFQCFIPKKRLTN